MSFYSNSLKIINQKKFFSACIACFFILLSWSYAQMSYPDVVWQDGVFIIDFIHQPHIGISSWFPVFGEHLLPFWRAIIALSIQVNRLDMRIDCVVFILANTLFFTGSLYAIRQQVSKASHQTFLICGIAIGFISFSLVQPPMTLMSSQFSLGSAIGLWVAVIGSELSEQRNFRILTVYLLLVLGYFLCAGGYFPGLVTGMIALSLGIAARGRFNRKFLVWTLTPVIITAICYLVLIRHLKAGAPLTSSSDVITRALDLKDTALWVLTAIGGSVIDIHTIMDHGWPVQLIPTIGFFLVVIAAAMLVLLRKSFPAISPVALYALAYPIGIVVAVHAGRGGDGVGYDWIVNEWYSFHFKFFLLGITIIAAEQFIAVGWRNGGALTYVVGMAVILPLIIISNISQWNRGPHIHAWLLEKRNAMKSPASDERAKSLCWERASIDRVMPFLQDQHLSAFRDSSFCEPSIAASTASWYADGWMGPKVQLIVNVNEPAEFQIRLWTPMELQEAIMSIKVNGTVRQTLQLHASTSIITSFQVSAGRSEILFETSKSFVPSEIGTNADARNLSVIGTLYRQTYEQVYPSNAH